MSVNEIKKIKLSDGNEYFLKDIVARANMLPTATDPGTAAIQDGTQQIAAKGYGGYDLPNTGLKIEWDGSTTGRFPVSLIGFNYYLVDDTVAESADLIGGTVTFTNGSELVPVPIYTSGEDKNVYTFDQLAPAFEEEFTIISGDASKLLCVAFDSLPVAIFSSETQTITIQPVGETETQALNFSTGTYFMQIPDSMQTCKVAVPAKRATIDQELLPLDLVGPDTTIDPATATHDNVPTTKAVSDFAVAPKITLTTSQVISQSPVTIQLTDAQAAIIESDTHTGIIIDASALGEMKAQFTRSAGASTDSYRLFTMVDEGGSVQLVAYTDSSKQATWTSIQLASAITGTGSESEYASTKAVVDYATAAGEALLEVIEEQLETKEDLTNKVTSLSSSSTDTQYPSAKCVYDLKGKVSADPSAAESDIGILELF